MKEIEIGWSEVSITPDEPIKLAGQFFERISEYVETPITVTAMAVKGDDQAVIVSCDLVDIGKKLLEKVRKRVSESAIDIDVEKIVIGATHTHTSFVYSDEKESSTIVLDKYLPLKPQAEGKNNKSDFMDPKKASEFIEERIARAVIEAWNNLQPVYIANEFSRAVVGMNRRVCYSDGSAKMWGNTDNANFTGLEGGNDSGVELLYVFDINKVLTGVVMNIACPSQVVEHRNFISSDYWGKVRIKLREAFGKNLKTLCLCGAAGDQCPRDLVRWVEPETPTGDPNITRINPKKRKADCSMFDIKGAEEIARRISREVIDKYDDALKDMKKETCFKHRAESLALPLRRVSEREYNEALTKVERFVRKRDSAKPVTGEERNAMHLPCGIIDRYTRQQTENTYQTELHVMRLGNIAFATNPFELFLNYGLIIKARSLAEQTFLMQLTCGSGGYLPTPEAERGGHYSAYVTSGNVGHEGGDILVRRTLDIINQLFQDKAHGLK